jgi:heat shock protein HspQ
MKNSRFNIGQVVTHVSHGYSAIIVDIDSLFQPSGLLNPHTIKQQFTKPGPWYRLLVNDSELVTYVDESDIQLENTTLQVTHPHLEDFLIQKAGQYCRKGLWH